jgi:chromate transporter
MSEQHFLDLVGATNLIPGPNSTEMAIHIGQKERAGWKGLVVAAHVFYFACGFNNWMFCLVVQRIRATPEIKPSCMAFSLAIIAIIIMALPLATKSLKQLN